MQYNLIDEAWIPVLWDNGRVSRVGIKDALIQAGKIRQIAASNPMDRVAILRFLLALVYWCRGSPSEGDIKTTGESFPEEWFGKLDENRECFNLLGEGRRFCQNKNARRPRTATDLFQEIPTGNNFWHFWHSTDNKEGLCPACCAMGLLRLPLFSVSGLPDLKSGINGTPPVYILPWGKSLMQTLTVNWLPCNNLGDPSWMHPDLRPKPEQPVPLLTGLTLLSRRVWLHDPEHLGQCFCCGSSEKMMIRSCEYQSAGIQENERWNDPHVVYLDKTPRKTARASDLTAAGKFKMDRPWPDLLARMVETKKFGRESNPISLLVVGFATDKAKNIDVWERFMVLPTLSEVQATAGEFLQHWRQEGWRLEKQLEWFMRSKVGGAAAASAVRPHIENGVSQRAGELLTASETAWNEAASEYRPMMEMIAKSLAPGFTAMAVRRRRQIEKVLPDMRLKKEVEKKPRLKKGGDE